MKTIAKMLVVGFLAYIFASQAQAQQQYKVTARRVASNLYQVIEGDLLVKTSMCLSLALLEPAILSQFEIRFPKERENCMVRGIFRKVDLAAGNYRAYIVRQDDDFYQIAPNLFARTSMCLSLALGENGVLEWHGPSGILKIGDRSSSDECMVESLYQAHRLP
jgi:hypothetical protein